MITYSRIVGGYDVWLGSRRIGQVHQLAARYVAVFPDGRRSRSFGTLSLAGSRLTDIGVQNRVQSGPAVSESSQVSPDDPAG